MNKPDTLTLARREAAASITWPDRTPLLMNPDPAARLKLAKFGALAAALLAVWILCSGPGELLQDWLYARENRAMRPAMESAMKAGNRTAATWLGLNYWEEYPGLLQSEAEAGEPTAMLIVGRFLVLEDHPGRFFKIDRSLTPQQLHAKGLELVRKAAAAGNEDALKFALQHGGT